MTTMTHHAPSPPCCTACSPQADAGLAGDDPAFGRRSPRRRTGAPDARQQDRLPRLLRQPEGRSARRVAGDRRAALHAARRSSRAKRSSSSGPRSGISTLHLAAALRDNGGGRLITSEFEPSKVARARAQPDRRRPRRPGRDPRGRRVADARGGPARDHRPRCCSTAPRALYPEILALGRKPPEVRARSSSPTTPTYSPDYLARVRSPQRGYLSTPFGDDVEAVDAADLSSRPGGPIVSSRNIRPTPRRGPRRLEARIGDCPCAPPPTDP